VVKLNVRKKGMSLNFNNNWVYGQQDRELTNNDFSSSLDLNLYKAASHFLLGSGQLQYEQVFKGEQSTPCWCRSGLVFTIEKTLTLI
jgi:hypothetical protein